MYIPNSGEEASCNGNFIPATVDQLHDLRVDLIRMHNIVAGPYAGSGESIAKSPEKILTLSGNSLNREIVIGENDVRYVHTKKTPTEWGYREVINTFSLRGTNPTGETSTHTTVQTDFEVSFGNSQCPKPMSIPVHLTTPIGSEQCLELSGGLQTVISEHIVPGIPESTLAAASQKQGLIGRLAAMYAGLRRNS